MRCIEEEDEGGVVFHRPDDIPLAMQTMMLSRQWPGVSIDPVPATDGRGMEAQQRVVYFGNVYGTRAGNTYFVSDYWMKQAALAAISVPVRGFRPYSDYICEEMVDDPSHGHRQAGARFWFYPRRYEFRGPEDRRSMTLGGGGMQILTEASYLSWSGAQAAPAGRITESAGQAFATHMTEQYDHIGRLFKPLLELRVFTDLCAAFKWLDWERLPLEPWHFLLFGYATMPAYTPDVAKTLTAPIRTAPGHYLAGGVLVEIRSERPWVIDTSPVLTEDATVALASQPDKDSLYWFY